MMILNEELYAKNLLLGKNKDVKSTIQKIGYITRYNAQILNKNESQNYISTVQWLNKHQDNFDESSYSNVISKAIKVANKKPFYKIDNIIITKKEFNIIESLGNIREEKILFVLLCMAKQQALSFSFSDGLVKYTITNLCNMARISVPADDREYILHDILTKGLISCPKKNDTKCLKVNFIDVDGDAQLILNEVDCQELAYVYLREKDGKGFKRCKSCGRLMRSNGHKDVCTYCEHSPKDATHIWCIDCGDEVEVNQFATGACRCEKCNKVYQLKRDREKHKAKYDRDKSLTVASKYTIQN